MGLTEKIPSTKRLSMLVEAVITEVLWVWITRTVRLGISEFVNITRDRDVLQRIGDHALFVEAT
jgi:hypothetical protein